MLKILTDALFAERAVEPMPGPESGFRGAAVGRFEPIDGASIEAMEAASELCPTGAIGVGRADGSAHVIIDDGRCVQCGMCAEGQGAAFANVAKEPTMGRTRDALYRRVALANDPERSFGFDPAVDDVDRVKQDGPRLADAIRARFGRSLHVRHMDAGGCNGCDWELNQLQAPQYDVQRFGVDFVASPRHADVLLVTGVMTRNLELALIRTLDAMPRPRIVVAMGACAVSGGIFGTSYASRGGVDRIVAVDAYLAGCPPRPWAIIRALQLAISP